MREDRVGCLWVVVFITLTFLGVCFLPQPAEAATCVPYADRCLPAYVVRWLPPDVPGPSQGPLVSPEAQAQLIASHFWPTWAVPRMMRIAACESGFDPKAVNPRSGAAGIWQVMPQWKRLWPGDHLDPWTNGAVAYQIWLVQGFDAWVCK